VLVIEISNEAGRRQYHRGPTSLMGDAGATFGAKPIHTTCVDTGRRTSDKYAFPSKPFCHATDYLHVRTDTEVTMGDGHTPLGEIRAPTPRRFPTGRRVFTDGSLIDHTDVGAAYYREDTDTTVHISVDQEPNILRAELTAILQAVQDYREDPEVLQIFTDSLLSIRLVHRWMHVPTALERTDHMDLLDSLLRAVSDRRGRTEIYKVRAHIGVEGNERADTGAKRVAMGEQTDLRSPSIEYSRTSKAHPFALADGSKLRQFRKQLRPVITDWLVLHRGYARKVHDMWSSPQAAHLDPVASNTVLWGSSGSGGMFRPEQVLRSRALDLVTNDKLHRQNPAKYPSGKCDLCGAKDANWFHILNMCSHPDISDFYTVRHNDIGKALMKGIRNGKLGRWLTITSFGRTDGEREQDTIPAWMLSSGGRERVTRGTPSVGTAGERHDVERSGIRPDIMVLEGWPETGAPPEGPTTRWQSPDGGESRRVRIILGELGCSSDLQFMSTVGRKQTKYASLMEALREEGWDVVPELQVVTVGVRATVPMRNIDSLHAMGVTTRAAQKEVQLNATRKAAHHLNRIIRQYRKLCRRQIHHARRTAQQVGGSSTNEAMRPCICRCRKLRCIEERCDHCGDKGQQCLVVGGRRGFTSSKGSSHSKSYKKTQNNRNFLKEYRTGVG